MIDYSKVVAVTNRHLCYKDYFEQIKKIIDIGVRTIIVREKDMTESGYLALYEGVLKVCAASGLPDGEILCIPHFYPKACDRFKSKTLHLPFAMFQEYVKEHENTIEQHYPIHIATSIHSVKEAVLAEKLGAAYITAGHIFVTDCKMGVMPRGLDFLGDVCRHVSIPVYAIGGINESNYKSALDAGAAKVCMMSEMMRI